jgi:hypothetical protein
LNTTRGDKRRQEERKTRVSNWLVSFVVSIDKATAHKHHEHHKHHNKAAYPAFSSAYQDYYYYYCNTNNGSSVV